MIRDSNGTSYPLFLLIEAPLSALESDGRTKQALGDSAVYMKTKIKHTVRFEQAAVLLDQDIQFLLFNFRVELRERSSRTSQEEAILNIACLKRKCLT